MIATLSCADPAVAPETLLRTFGGHLLTCSVVLGPNISSSHECPVFPRFPGPARLSLAVTHPSASLLSWLRFFSAPFENHVWVLRLSPRDFGLVDLNVRYFESGLIYPSLQPLVHNPEIPKALKSEECYIIHVGQACPGLT